MHQRPTIATVVWLACGLAGIAGETDCRGADDGPKPGPSKNLAGQNIPPEKAPNAGTARKKASDLELSATKKTDPDKAPKKAPDRDSALSMEPGVVCKSIDGFEKYERLVGATQTHDEKLLVYVRPLGFKSEKVDGAFQAHLATDCEVRKRGATAVLFQKKRIYEYKPRAQEPPQSVYLKNAFSIKGLAPGNYDLTLILHDEIAKGSPASQVVKFKVIPVKNSNKKKIRNDPSDANILYLPFLEEPESEDGE